MDIEAKIIDYLRTALRTEDVYGEIPDTQPEEYYVIDKTGSATENLICTSTVAIQSYAGSKARASELNEGVKAAMEDFMFQEDISDCHLNTDYNFSNIAKKQHRYQAVFEITHYQEED